MEFEEFGQRDKGILGRRPQKGNSSLWLGVLVLALVAIIVASIAFNLVPLKGAPGVTGMTVSTPEPSYRTGTDVKSIKNIKISSDMLADSFEIPLDKKEIIVSADEIQIVTSSADIVVNLDKQIRFENFSGRLYWRDSMFILEGRMSQSLSEAIKLNWKGNDEMKIRVIKGTVEIPSVSVPVFESKVSGSLKVGEKATLSPTGDSLRLDYYRGYFKAVVGEAETRVILDGSAEGMALGNQEFSLNVE